MIEVRCHATLAEAAPLREAIDALNRASSRPDPFSNFAFYENYLAHDEQCPDGTTWPLWFLVAFDAGRLVGYLPLKRTAQRVFGLRTWKIDCLVTHDTDRPHLVAEVGREAAVAAAFWDYLLRRRREWSLVELQQQTDGSPLFPPPVARHGCALRQWPSLENGTIALRWASLDGFFRSCSKKFRSNLSRQMRSLLAAGTVEVLSSTDPRVTPILFELCRSIEPRSWKSLADAAIGRHPKRVDYFRGLLDAHQPMRLAVHVVLLDALPCAALITGRFGTQLYALHIVYDRSLQKLGPGSAVLLLGLRQALDDGCEAFNLLSGFGYYKHRWQADLTPAWNAQVYRRGSLLHWRRVLGDLQRRLTRRGRDQASVLFNPARRDAEHGDDDEALAQPAPRTVEVTAGERARIAQWLAQARSGGCDVLDAAGLAAILPFETRRAVAPAARAAGSTRPATTGAQRASVVPSAAGSAAGSAGAGVAVPLAGSAPPA